jgi:SagB-type dehydrogenase family enzyme
MTNMQRRFELFRSSLELREAEHTPMNEYSIALSNIALTAGPFYRPSAIVNIDDAKTRRSHNSIDTGQLLDSEVATLLHLSLFATSEGNRRPYPAAGALYATHVYVAAYKVDGLEPGVYYVRWSERALEKINTVEAATHFLAFEVDQDGKESIPCLILVMLDTRLSYAKYGDRVVRFGLLEAGALIQTIYLAGEKLGLSICGLGTVCDRAALRLCKLPPADQLYYGAAVSVAGSKRR